MALDLTIVVVSYNTKAMTLACLDTILRETWEVRYEVIVVDNASGDGSAAAIAHHPLRPRLIASPVNLGFAGANNLAASHAQGRYILLLNPDTEIKGRAIDRLVAFARQTPWAGIWGGRTVFADGRLNPSSCWRRMTVWNLICRATGLTGLFPRSALFNSEAYGGWRRDSVREVDIVSGCFLLTTRELWQRLAGFHPDFFMYGEEADFCLRARRLGARPLVTPTATIVHHGGASETTRVGKMTKLLAAKTLLIERHWPAWKAPIGKLLLATWPLTRSVALRLAGVLPGQERRRTEAQTWRDIWRERRQWLAAYGRANRAGSVPA